MAHAEVSIARHREHPPLTRPSAGPAGPAPPRYWALAPEALAVALGSGPDGLSEAEARRRTEVYGPNTLREQERHTRLDVLLRQAKSPLLLLLVFAAAASLLTGAYIDAGIVLAIVLATVGVGYSREYSAHAAAARLRAGIAPRARVVRDGQVQTIPSVEIVPGDLVLLSAGSLVPADGILLEATDLFVSESALTGESFPVQKSPGAVGADAELSERANAVYLGTNVRSGAGRCYVVATGGATAFGAIARRLALAPPETEFARGIRRFGYLLTVAMAVMVLVVFSVHLLRGRPAIETLLFAVALAVGLSPELLPAIISVNLARGAQLMAKRGVLVRRLEAIENLGSMDVLCTDKTGTLTEGVVRLEGAYDPAGNSSPEVLALGIANARLATGIASPLDDAITAAGTAPAPLPAKLGELPFDFMRKRMSVVTAEGSGARLVTKGAFGPVLEVCTRAADGTSLGDAERTALSARYEAWGNAGIRVLAVATRALPARPAYRREDETEMTFAGFLTFLDRPKEGAAETLKELAALGVSVRLITGDNRLVARHLATLVGMHADRILTGRELDALSASAFGPAVDATDLFVEVDPDQKERIIASLRASGHVVGFMGDGVNDAPAMHAADTSLSVDQAVDVAREAADFVLLERGLDVIRGGIEEGRRTFANTLKYILMTTSANLGNMVSMAAISLVLPYLPLTAGQILLNNFLSDVPAVGIADDSVDPEMVARPRRWDIRVIGRYMVSFGLLSSAFDALTFVTLLAIFRAEAATFQTGWFVESLLTELAVALVMRTQRPFYRSRPGTVLLGSTLVLIVVALAIPYLPLVGVFGFVPLPGRLLGMVLAITAAYVAATEVQKRWFYRHAA